MITTRRASRRLPFAAAALVLLLASSPALAASGKKDSGFKGGAYTGKTEQETVAAEARKLEFTIKKGKVKLITEPVVRRDFCLSPPVFTLEGATPKKPLSSRGAFSFTHTFLGTKIDKISGRFVSPNQIEGFAVYNFQGSDLCSPGSAKVAFKATQEKKKKK